MSAAVLVRLEGAALRCGTVEALAPLDLRVDPGDVVAVTGPSGSGKSTLLHLLALLLPPTAGYARILGEDARSLAPPRADRLRRGRIAISLQEDPLVEAATALENVAVARRISGSARTDGEALARARTDLDGVGLGPRAGFRAGRLSGGERSRLALVRALATGKHLVLADEPTASLDPDTGLAVLAAILAALGSGPPRGFVAATHDPAVARLAARAVDLSRQRPAEGPGNGEDRRAPSPGEVLIEARGLRRAFRGPWGEVPVLKDIAVKLARRLPVEG